MPRRLLTSFLRLALPLSLLLLPALPLLARAGGAGGIRGGGGGGGDGDGGLGVIVFYLIEFLFRVLGPGPTLIIIVVIIVIGYLMRRRARHQRTNTFEVLRRQQTSRVDSKTSGMDRFRRLHPDFDEKTFLGKVETAFMAIQQAWSTQNLKDIRRFISDGVYQRFHAQFAMMRQLEQKNLLSDIRIHDCAIVEARREGPYDILVVAINASIYDRFICGVSSALNTENHDTFTEYWTFLRRGSPVQSSTWGEIYTSNDCPHCSAPLGEELGERGNCPHCNALVNSGAFDWVLAGIEQEGDHAASLAFRNRAKINASLERLYKSLPDFSAHLMEDKAANAWLQLLVGKASRHPEGLRRFTSASLFERIQRELPEKPLAYNRLWLNQVQLIGVWSQEDHHSLAFAINTSSQRVVILGQRNVRFLDPVIRQESSILIMGRSASPGQAKGNLYQHQCPSCGATIADSLDTQCPYCQNELAASSLEWVVEDILDRSAYAAWQARQGSQVRFRLDPASFDQLLDVRDYAFNNFLVMIAADGVFADEERQMAGELAKRLGYRVDDMESLYAMALNGRLSLRMPDSVTQRQKIFEMLQAAARVDGQISQEEQDLLDYLVQQYPGCGGSI